MRRLLPLLFLAVGCSRELSNEQLIQKSLEAERIGPPLLKAGHDGPGVAHGTQGPARFANQVLAAFSAERALATTAFADRYYRAPANDGYEAVIDEVIARLHDAGYGTTPLPDLAAAADMLALRLDVIVTPRKTPAWTPHRARLAFVGSDGNETLLHEFRGPEDPDRTMLPVNAPSARVEGVLATTMESLTTGGVLLIDTPLAESVLDAARERGAVLVISSDLADVNVDPVKGGERHLDAIGFRQVRPGCTMPVAQISPRTAATLKTALEKNPSARVRFECETTFTERPLRTVVATIEGRTKPDECVVTMAHVQEPGACDNASGVGTALEAARVTAQLLLSGELERPARSVCFVFGDEMAQSRIFLDRDAPLGGTTKPVCVAAIAADMTGESFAKTGAVALLERGPDPGAVRALPPDRHTAWLHGSRSTASADELVPNGLATIVRCAMIDVGALQKDWKTSEHPFEGGSDHVVFLGRGIPAVLLWHFPDFAYHTSLDRLDHVDPEEMRRTGTVLVSALMALADPKPTDLDRYLRSLRTEIDVRLEAAATVGDEAIADAWKAWSTGARLWLRALCLGTPLPTRTTESKKP